MFLRKSSKTLSASSLSGSKSKKYQVLPSLSLSEGDNKNKVEEGSCDDSGILEEDLGKSVGEKNQKEESSPPSTTTTTITSPKKQKATISRENSSDLEKNRNSEQFSSEIEEEHGGKLNDAYFPSNAKNDDQELMIQREDTQSVDTFFTDMEKMKDFQATLEMISTASLDPIVIIDEQGKVKSINQETLDLFGYKMWELVGRNVKILMPTEYASKHDFYLQRYKMTKMKRIIGQRRNGITGLKKNGALVQLNSKIQAINDSHGTVYIGVLKDVGSDDELMKIKDMINHMLPKGYEEKIMSGQNIADEYNGSVLFADLVEFTKFSEKAKPEQIIATLNTIFGYFDEICKELKVEKIKTIGDCYMAACGVTKVRYDSAIRCVEAGGKMINIMKNKVTDFKIRVGIASGLIVSGVLKGEKLTFDIWGDTVNVASRLEGLAPQEGIRVCENTFKQTKYMYEYHAMEEIQVKGKGMMKTYVLKGKKKQFNKGYAK